MSDFKCYACYEDSTVELIEFKKNNIISHSVIQPNDTLDKNECFPAGFKEERKKIAMSSGGSKPIACAERFKIDDKPNQTLQWVNFSVTLFFASVVMWFLFRMYR